MLLFFFLNIQTKAAFWTERSKVKIICYKLKDLTYFHFYLVTGKNLNYFYDGWFYLRGCWKNSELVQEFLSLPKFWCLVRFWKWVGQRTFQHVLMLIDPHIWDVKRKWINKYIPNWPLKIYIWNLGLFCLDLKRCSIVYTPQPNYMHTLIKPFYTEQTTLQYNAVKNFLKIIKY